MKRHKTRYAGVTYRFLANGKRRYYIDYTDSNDKRTWKAVPGTERDALRERAEVLRKMSRGERVVNTRLTVKELGEEWHRTQTSRLREKTKSDYGYALDHWVYPKLGNRKIADIDVNVIADFVAEMNQTYSGSTVRNSLKPLSLMFQYAQRRGWVSFNPVSQLTRNEMPKGSPRRMRILETDEIQKLLAVKFGEKKTPSVYRLLFMTAIFTGLRKGELLSLTWADVDLAEAILRVAPEGHGKTPAATREVALPDFLVQELAREDGLEGLVFRFQKDNVNRALETAREAAGIPKFDKRGQRLRFHDLRHTFASLLIGQGEDVTYVADQMGHANAGTTLKVYAKLFDSRKKKSEARERMQESFKGVIA